MLTLKIHFNDSAYQREISIYFIKSMKRKSDLFLIKNLN